MRDFRDLHLYTRAGRQHVEDWIGFLLGHAQLLALVPVFQSGLSLEENARNLRDAGKVDKQATRIRWCQGDYLYCGDVGLLILAAQEKDRAAFVLYLNGLRDRFNQAAYMLIENGNAVLVGKDGTTPLATQFTSLDSLDILARTLIPAWTTTEGNFDRSISFVQMRDYQTRPRPGQVEQNSPKEEA